MSHAAATGSVLPAELVQVLSEVVQHQVPESGVVQVGGVSGVRDHTDRGRLNLTEILQRRLAQTTVPGAVNDGGRYLMVGREAEL